MGAIVSVIVTIIALLAVGGMNAYSASKASKCREARTWNIISSAIAFTIAIVAAIISIIFL